MSVFLEAVIVCEASGPRPNRVVQSSQEGSEMGRDRRQRRRRAAVVGGTVAAAKHHHDAKQAEETAVPPSSAEPAQAAAPDSGGLTRDAIEELKQLGDLHEQNVLTDEEFAREKARILGHA